MCLKFIQVPSFGTCPASLNYRSLRRRLERRVDIGTRLAITGGTRRNWHIECNVPSASALHYVIPVALG